MAIDDPTRDEVRAAAADLGLDLDDATCAAYLALMQPTVAAYRALEEFDPPRPEQRGRERSWRRPEPEENPLGAWYVRTDITTATDGPLAGRTVALKDNVALAGVPMMNGASILADFVPDVDATIVTRLLDAGATITGKAHCEYFCFSGGSHTGAAGPVRNPRKPTHSAGGSSSGSAALVASGAVDLAIGGDQGGSIRIPAGWSGAYGMKSTWGLVPYTGVMPIEATVDHTGPITASVADNALMIEVLAGPDGLDARQSGAASERYTEALTGDCSGLRIGVVAEGFGQPGAEADVDDIVKAAADTLAELGAKVEEVSVPMHLLGPVVWSPIALEGHVVQMLMGHGYGMNRKGFYDTTLMSALVGWRSRSDEFSESLKVSMISGNLFLRRYGGATYGRAMNAARSLTAAYDAALAAHDVLLMPTLPMKATPLPPADAPRELVIQRALEMIANTAPFDATGHPAMNVPCGLSDELPVGMMLIGRHLDERVIYRVAHAFEHSGDWTRR